MRRAFVSRLLILLVCALVPLALYVVLNPPNPKNLKEIAQRAANEYDRLLQLRMQQAFTLAAFPSIRAFAASDAGTRSERASVALNELKALVASDKHVREALIVDTEGTVIMSTLDGWGKLLSQRQFIQDALNGQIAVSPISRDRAEYSNYYAAPILNNAGEMAGAFVMRVDAQELWNVLPRGERWHAVLSDENGVRLDDTGEPAQRMASFGAMDAGRATRISQSQSYGAELPLVRATKLERAQQLLTQGALDQLRATDFNAGELTYQRLVTKPWNVLVMSPQSSLVEMLSALALPALVAVLLALGGAFVLERV